MRAHAVALGDDQGFLVFGEPSLLYHEDELVHDLAHEDRLEVRNLAQAGPPAGAADLSAVVVVQVADDAVAPVRMRLDEVSELGRLVPGPDEQHGAEVQPPRAHPARDQTQRDFLGGQEREVDESEDGKEKPAHELHAQAVDEERQDRGAAEGDLDCAPDLLDERRRAVAAVEAGAVEQQAPERKDQKEEEQVFLDRRNGHPEEGRVQPGENGVPDHVNTWIVSSVWKPFRIPGPSY